MSNQACSGKAGIDIATRKGYFLISDQQDRQVRQLCLIPYKMYTFTRYYLHEVGLWHTVTIYMINDNCRS